MGCSSSARKKKQNPGPILRSGDALSCPLDLRNPLAPRRFIPAQAGLLTSPLSRRPSQSPSEGQWHATAERVPHLHKTFGGAGLQRRARSRLQRDSLLCLQTAPELMVHLIRQNLFSVQTNVRPKFGPSDMAQPLWLSRLPPSSRLSLGRMKYKKPLP
jgi:hypothetical protein